MVNDAPEGESPPKSPAQPGSSTSSSHSQEHAAIRHAVVLAVVLWSGLLISLSFFLLLRTWERDEIRNGVQSILSDRVERVRAQTSHSIETLHSIAAFFGASEEVTRAEFDLFTGYAVDRQPGLLLLEWQPRVLRRDRARYEALARRDGLTGFRFVEPNEEGELVPARDREEHFPVYYRRSLRESENTLGLDLAWSPLRMESKYMARDSAKPVASASFPVVVTEGERNQLGLAISLPVYSKERPVSIEERRASLRGFIASVVFIKELVDPHFRDLDHLGLQVRISDLSAGGGVIYELRAQDAATGAPTRDAARGDFTVSERLDFAEREWLVEMTPRESFIAGQRSWSPWAALLIGAVITAMLVFYIRMVHRRSLDVASANVRLRDEVTTRRRVEEEREQVIRDLEQALSQVKTLRGLLPICASCKRIRDDKGYWRQVESYITEHSDARLTHGICPDCAREMYGEYLPGKPRNQ